MPKDNDEMVERVAKALGELTSPGSWDRLSADARTGFRRRAVIAIDAMDINNASEITRPLVFQSWMFRLTMQQQSVLVLACRGPDGIAKFHQTKHIVGRYRATVLKAAYLGRPMLAEEGAKTFMTLANFSVEEHWKSLVTGFFNYADEIPHHYYMHLAHGAEIIGYKHPDALFRERWSYFYYRCCEDMHVMPETAEEMDERLCDWNREHWD